MSKALKALNLLIALSAVTAIVLEQSGKQALYQYLKPLTTVLIIVISMLFGKNAPNRYWLLTVAGLILCLIGDIFLLDAANFLYGLVSFLLAHVLFTLSFISLHKFKTYWQPIALLLLIGLSYYYFLLPSLQEMALPVFAYFLFIVVMCWQGINLYLWKPKPAFLLIAIGVVLFLASDSILAYNKFVASFGLAGVLILTTYWLAVGLLANATVLLGGKTQ